MKKIIAIFLCVALLAGTLVLGITDFPFITKASANNDDKVSEASTPNVSEPPGFSTAKDPYKLIGTNNTKTLTAQSELMVNISDHNTSNDFSYALGDNLKLNKITGDEALDMNAQSEYWGSTDGRTGTVGSVYYIRSAALDSDGDGTRESVIYIGWDKNASGTNGNEKIVAWKVNTKTKQQSAKVRVCHSAAGIDDLPTRDATYQALNFFSITAGDFNGDGKETAVAAVPGKNGDNANPCLVQLSVSGNSLSVGTPGYTGYMHSEYRTSNILDTGNYNDLLSTLITSGDFNSDGIDDIAVLSYTNETSNSYNGASTRGRYTPFLSVGYGSSNGIPTNPSSTVWVEKSIQNDSNHYEIPLAGNVIGADIDNDGRDEIVVAGYYCKTENSSGWRMDDSSRSANKLVCLTYKNYSGTALTPLSAGTPEANTWTKGDADTGIWCGTGATSAWCWQPIGLGAAALDGIGKRKYLFISGDIYQYNSNSNSLTFLKTPGYFGICDDFSGGWTVSVNFISDVANGVFDGNINSVEQFAVLVGMKQNSTEAYRYLLGIIGRRDTSSGREFYWNDIEDSQKFGGGDQYSGSIEAVDCDNDMIKIRFNRKDYGWTDPDVVAILQAAPYFGELGGGDGSTSIEFSTSYESEYAHSVTQSLGVGASVSLDLEVIEAEIKAGYEGEWSETTFNNQATASAFSITADGDNNKVIIRRTPAFYFGYDVWDQATNTWLEDKYHIDVIKDAQYYEFSIDEYNRFVEIYTDKMTAAHGNNYSKKLNKITDSNAPYLVNNIGNPFAYEEGQIGTLTAVLGHSGGSQSISYESSVGTGTTTSESSAFTFEFASAGGAPMAKIGVYGSTSYADGYETTQTVVTGTGTSGEVPNLNSANIAAETGSPSYLVDQYGFTWSFGQWPLSGVVDGKQVPVYGYKLTDISGPAPRVTDLAYTVTNGGTDLSFTWSEPDTADNVEIAGYFLYMSVDGGTFTKVSDEIITDTEFTLTQDLYDRTKGLEFAVTSAIEKRYPNDEIYYSEGMLSNHCHFNGDLNGKSAYEIAREEGFDGTLEEWLESLKGAHVTSVEKTGTSGLVDTYTVTFSDGSSSFFTVTNGEDGLSAYEVAKSNGYTGTEEQWLTLIGADCASGHDYTEFTMPASCGRPGFTIKVCSKCGSSELTTTAALEHNYEATDIPATHTTCGYTRYVCSNCGDTYCDNLTPVTDHTYTENVIAPTCVESGYTEKTCSECGIVIRTDVVPATGHDYAERVATPTCVESGYTEKTCPDCGLVIRTDVVPAKGHDYVEKVVAPTCIESGYTEKTCSECGLVIRTDVVPANGHSYKGTVTNPTCGHSGYTTYKCENCDAEYVSDVTPALEHNFKTRVVETTCCEDGFKIKYCADCGYSVIEDEEAAKGHNFEITNVFEPTCSETGYSIYTCSECGVNYMDDETAKLPHTPGEWICEDPATGRYVQRCEKCYELLDTKTIAIVGGNNGGESGEGGEGGEGGESGLNPDIDETGVLYIGYLESKKVSLKVDGIDTSSVAYTSSDPKVATVDSEGNITAVGPGDAVITANVPGTAISTSVPVSVKLTWWQKIHYILNASPIFRIIFMLFKIPAYDGLPK